ncbi:MAG: hypothetical protein ABSF61_07740 [Anaerolineales bacterium]
MWACDFLPVIDLFFRQIYEFLIIELASRRIVHFGVTSHRIDAWLEQGLREATPYGQAPRSLIRGQDRRFGQAFARVAKESSIEILKTPYRALKANAVCERFLGSVRREYLDQLVIVAERHLHHVIQEYVCFFNCARSHQGIEQGTPGRIASEPARQEGGKILALAVLNGLHNEYRRAVRVGNSPNKFARGCWRPQTSPSSRASGRAAPLPRKLDTRESWA